MSTELAVRPKVPTFYELEDNLVAILNSIDMVEGEERAEAEAMVLQAHLAAVEKRDRVSQFLSHLDSQMEAIDKEMERLQNFKKGLAGLSERTKTYIVNTILALGPDDKGKLRKLAGNTCQFWVQAKPESVQTLDEDKIPVSMLTYTVSVNGADWQAFTDELDAERWMAFQKLVKITQAPNRTLIRKTIEDARAQVKPPLDASVEAMEAASDAIDAAENVVPGARLASSGYSLRRK